VIAELCLNWLLFSDAHALVQAGRSLRQPGRWASQRDESLYWELDAYWGGSTRRRLEPNCPDPLLGWVKNDLTIATYKHRDDVLDSKRPVLLYGDSFAQGVTRPGSRFEALFKDTEESATHRLLNYGVGGYGIDQAFLLAKNSIDHFEGRDPLVIFSLLVDDDLDRAVLDFRCWPKPRLHLEGDHLVVTPPATTSGSAHLAKEDFRLQSWLLRFLRGLEGTQATRHHESESVREEKKELFVAVMRELKEELNSRGTEWFVMLFVGRRAMISPTPSDWREPFVLQTLEELEIPFVITRPDLAAVGEQYLQRPEDLYILKGHGLNHHNRAGNYASLQTMLRGMRGEFDPYEFQPASFPSRESIQASKERRRAVEAAARRPEKAISEAAARRPAPDEPRNE
jgi:hypothetical protein